MKIKKMAGILLAAVLVVSLCNVVRVYAYDDDGSKANYTYDYEAAYGTNYGVDFTKRGFYGSGDRYVLIEGFGKATWMSDIYWYPDDITLECRYIAGGTGSIINSYGSNVSFSIDGVGISFNSERSEESKISICTWTYAYVGGDEFQLEATFEDKVRGMTTVDWMTFETRATFTMGNHIYSVITE